MSTKVMVDPQLPLVERDPKVIDAILGKKRFSPFNAFELRARNLAIASAYPDIDQFLAAIATERLEAYMRGREPHPATQPPTPRQPARDPVMPGPSASQVRRAYGSKDSG